MSSFISPSPSPSTDYDRLKDGAGGVNGSPTFSPSVGRTNLTYRAMEAAFIRWHVTGCFAAAADYSRARTDWELSLMASPEGQVA